MIDTSTGHARRLERDPSQRVLAGVASGIAVHLGLPVIAVRVAFVVILAYSGLGALLYAVFWAVLPLAPARPVRRRDPVQLILFAVIGVGIIMLQTHSGLGASANQTALGWLVAVVALGAGVIWHHAAPSRRQVRLESISQLPLIGGIMAENDRRAYLLRFIGGGVLVAVGIIGIIAVFSPISGAGFSSLVNSVIFALVALAGVGLVVAPVLWRIFGQLRAEREARIREQERAEVAAVVHDQVLHTLALIQRRSGDAKAVLSLARGQERSLRNWLYKPTGSASEQFAAALEEVAAEVEGAYAIAVETVLVGDRTVDERVAALVAAVREALVNAARHAQVASVSLYAEVEADQISAYVRDRGVGFDPSTVAGDRHGVRGSIIARMERHGGQARVLSEPGEGTEVRLTMPLSEPTKGSGRE